MARRATQSQEATATDFGISATTLKRWLKDADIDDGIVDGVTSAEQAEIVALRRRNRLLEQEVEILRKLLLIASERLDEAQHERRVGLLTAGDPRDEVATAWLAKEAVREFYSFQAPDLAEEFLDSLVDDLLDPDFPPEVRRLGRTLHRWRSQLLAWHVAGVTNGPTESTNNLAKRVKRAAFGMTNFRHWRVRVLLYAGKPNWDLLPDLTPLTS